LEKPPEGEIRLVRTMENVFDYGIVEFFSTMPFTGSGYG
jgi:hypothetical protein